MGQTYILPKKKWHSFTWLNENNSFFNVQILGKRINFSLKARTLNHAHLSAKYEQFNVHLRVISSWKHNKLKPTISSWDKKNEFTTNAPGVIMEWYLTHTRIDWLR